MRVMLATVGVFAMIAGSPVMAQQATGSASASVAQNTVVQSDVNSYLCTFAGKCDAEGDGSTPTKAAPLTKGFRLATGAPVQPAAGAPVSRGLNVASVPMSGERNRAAFGRGVRAAQRRFVAPARAEMAPGAVPSVPRADLMLAFGYNSAQLTPAAEARARGFAQALMMDELKAKRFLIEGHTDLRGSRQGNIDLSRRRAQAVADFLVTLGVDRSRVEVKGVGPDEPLPGFSAKAEANRRVEAVLLS